MTDRISNQKVQHLLKAQGVQIPNQLSVKERLTQSKESSFDSIFKDRLKMSEHAKKRIESRSIDLNSERWERLLNGVDRAAEKGITQAAILDEGDAFIVSIKNRTLITAVGEEELHHNGMITNIDAVVFSKAGEDVG